MGIERISLLLLEGCFRSCLTQDEQYVLSCYRYIGLNPVRANMVLHPGVYPWSSDQYNAQGKSGSSLSLHPLYLALGRDNEEQQLAYRN